MRAYIAAIAALGLLVGRGRDPFTPRWTIATAVAGVGLLALALRAIQPVCGFEPPPNVRPLISAADFDSYARLPPVWTCVSFQGMTPLLLSLGMALLLVVVVRLQRESGRAPPMTPGGIWSIANGVMFSAPYVCCWVGAALNTLR